MLVEIRENDDPQAYGCTEAARGFPICTATVEHPVIGYADMFGWVQLAERDDKPAGFLTDPLELLTDTTHPFAFFGSSPTLFDNPHRDDEEDWDFLAHSFLCGLGGELLEFRREVRAVLGFSWGFRRGRGKIEFLDPALVSAEEWDGHRGYLASVYPKWSFAAGFQQHPLP
jgi:hypothetical protein